MQYKPEGGDRDSPIPVAILDVHKLFTSCIPVSCVHDVIVHSVEKGREKNRSAPNPSLHCCASLIVR